MTDTGALPPPPDAPGATSDAAVDETGGPGDAVPATATPDTPLTTIPTRPPRVGELTSGWRVVVVCCWIGVVASLAAIWNTSERLGLSTWWLGPRGEPMPMFVRLLPFVAPTLMILAVSNNVRWLWRWGVAAALVTAAFGIGDIGGVSGLAALELAVAAAALVVALASRTGTYRRVPDSRAAARG